MDSLPRGALHLAIIGDYSRIELQRLALVPDQAQRLGVATEDVG